MTNQLDNIFLLWHYSNIHLLYTLINNHNQNNYMQQFILIINGPIAGGKSSAIDAIMRQYKKIFRVSPNKIKFLISDYTPDRDRALVHESVLLLSEKMLQAGMSLILEGGSVMQGSLNQNLLNLGEKHGIKVTSVNIEAPLSILKKRFEDRVFQSIHRGSKISVTNEDGFMQRYDMYLSLKNSTDPTFDSNVQNPVDIAKRIMALVFSN